MISSYSTFEKCTILFFTFIKFLFFFVDQYQCIKPYRESITNSIRTLIASLTSLFHQPPSSPPELQHGRRRQRMWLSRKQLTPPPQLPPSQYHLLSNIHHRNHHRNCPSLGNSSLTKATLHPPRRNRLLLQRLRRPTERTQLQYPNHSHLS